MIFVSVRFHSLLTCVKEREGKGRRRKGCFFFPLKGCGIPIMDVLSDGVLGLYGMLLMANYTVRIAGTELYVPAVQTNTFLTS